MITARSLIGTKETAGPANNAKIMSWANKLGAKVLGIVYPNDATPWCGLFVAHCVTSAGLSAPAIAIRAKAWATWGQHVVPREGCVLVFNRDGGGHVGFYVGEDSTTYHVLGGNQSDAVNVTRILKSRMIASRWPSNVPVTGLPIRLNAKGAISTDER